MLPFLDSSPHEALRATYDETGDNISPYTAIKKKLYPVIIERAFLFYMNPARFGQDTGTGIESYDTRIAESRIKANITIEHMLNIFSLDGYLRIPNDKHRFEIYQILELHLKCCLLYNQDVTVANFVDMSEAPLIEEFLDAIHNVTYVTIHNDKHEATHSIDDSHTSIGFISKSSATMETRDAPNTRRNVVDVDKLTNDIEDDVAGSFTDFEFGG